jgi:hypothetical protein
VDPGFCHDLAVILYVYLPGEDADAEESVLTVSLTGHYYAVNAADLLSSTISVLIVLNAGNVCTSHHGDRVIATTVAQRY